MTRTHTLGKLLSNHEPFVAKVSPQAIPRALIVPFDYAPRSPPLVHHDRTEPQGGFDFREIELSNILSLDGRQTSLALEYFSPRRTKSPVVLIFPIMSGSSVIERFFARSLARQGLAAIILKDRQKVGPRDSAARLNMLLRQLVINARQTMDWIGV